MPSRPCLAAGLLLALFVPRAAKAGPDDAEAAAALRAKGAEVKEENGAVTAVSFRDCSKLGEDDFRRIGGLTRLKRLTLYGQCAGLNDRTLPLLAGLTELEVLQTDGVRVSDDGLRPLAGLKALRQLAFFHPSWGSKEFTGAGLAHLADLPALEDLTVAGSPFNDEGMAAVGALTRLKVLGTWHTAQTAAGTARLKGLTGLRRLHLGQTIFGDAPSLDDGTLTVLAGMTSLEALTLDEARFSLDALRRLKALPHLKSLTLQAVDLSPGDAERLRADLPGVDVKHAPPTEAQMRIIHRYFDRK